MSNYCQEAHIFAQHIVAALDCLNESKAMDQIFRSPEYKDYYKVAPHFYRTAYFAMQYRFQMEVAKLFDVDSKAKVFDQFKNELCGDGLLDKAMESQYSVLKKCAIKDIDEILSRRNKIYAHSDKECFKTPDTYLNEHPFDDTTVEKLLQAMLRICNSVILRFTEKGTAQLHSTFNSNDFIKLFGFETEDEKKVKIFLK